MMPISDHFMPEPCGRKNDLFEIFFLSNLFLHDLKSHKILDL